VEMELELSFEVEKVLLGGEPAGYCG